MVESKPLVSIIIPTKNSAYTLEACLKSIKAQTHPQIEIIVVDNYSRDLTVSIAERYGVKVFFKGPERGAQVNFGVAQARGKYVYRVDSDFVLDPDVVKEAVESSENFGYDGILIHNTSDATVSFWARVRKMERDSYREGEVNVAARFWKKEVFELAHGFDVDLVAGDDYDLQNRLVRHGRRIGRIKAQETHIGEPRNVAEIFSKHYYYGQSIKYFIHKNPKRAIAQLSPFRPSVAKGFSGPSYEPALILGFFVYQFLRYFAAGLGMISEILLPTYQPPNGNPKQEAKITLFKGIEMKRATLFTLVFFLLLNLRLLFWFQPNYVLANGDFRPPLNHSAFLNHALEPVNHVDFGITSVYAPRLLDPFTDILLALEYSGMATWVAELIATYIAYVLVSLLVYVLVRRLTKSNIAAFFGALFFTTNAFLVVDQGQIGIGYMELALALLPSIVVFVEALHRKSVKFAILAGVMFSFSFSFYPNFRQVIQAALSIVVLGIFYLLKDGFSVANLKIKARLASLFAVAAGIASSWVIALAALSYGSFLAAFNDAYAPQLYLTFHASLFDSFRLIAKWSFYSSALGQPYVPYSSTYLSNPILVALTLVPSALAFGSLLLVKQRKTALYFGGVSLVFLLLTGGVISLAGFPLMVVFRETFNYLWVVLLSFSVLIGLTASTIYYRLKTFKYQLLALAVIVVLLCVPAYPLFTGDVARGLDATHKGSYIPSYFTEVNNYANDNVLLLPQRKQYTVYSFADKGWLVLGNPYPIFFTVPYVAGIGTEYLHGQYQDQVKLCYDSALSTNGTKAAQALFKQGIRYVLAENSIIFGNLTALENYAALLNCSSLKTVKVWSEATLYQISP